VTQTLVFAIVSYSRTNTWSAETPEWMRVPVKSRGEVAYVIDEVPAGPPTPGTVCPYVFLRVTGVPDSVSKERLTEVLGRATQTLIDTDDVGGKAWRTDQRRNAKIDFTKLSPSVRLALLTPGNSATITMTDFADACDLYNRGRALRLADLT
jgi:hypothetical protein